MIDAINSVQTMPSMDLMDTVRQITRTENAMTGSGVSSSTATGDSKSPSFGDMLSGLISSVDAKSKAAKVDAMKVMTGESTNIHQAMLSMREAGVAFTMMSEVRNKLVSAYQELMRMQA